MSQKTSSLLKNLSVMTLSVGFTQIFALLLKSQMPRILGVEKMGIFTFAESQAVLFFAFLPLGLTTYINRHVPPKPDHIKDILWTVMGVQIVMGIVIAAALFASLVFRGIDTLTIMVTMILGLQFAFFTFNRDILQNIYIILGEISMVSRLNMAVKLILVGGSMAVLYTSPSLVGVAIMHFVSEASSGAYLIYKSFKHNFVRVTLGAPYLKTMLKFSLPFYFASVLNGIYGQIDITMLERLTTKIEIGYFGAAWKIIGIGLVLVPIFQNLVTPVLSQAQGRADGSFAVLIKEYLHILIVACLPLAVGLILFGDTIASIINGPAFDVSHRTLAYLTPVLLMMYLNTFVGSCLYLASSGQRLSIIFIIGCLINVILDTFLIPWGLAHFGVGGAGIAVSFSTFLCESYVFFAMLFMLPQRIISGRFIWNCLIIFLPCWLGIFFHDAMIPIPIWERLLIFPLVIPYAIVTGLLTRRDMQEIKTLLAKKRL
ncbi:MAG: oligosaccharide flippase family protein [Chitinophagaceae bacterium]|nr:oligosaccharide flippase family protein [Oligoflexus sp.]